MSRTWRLVGRTLLGALPLLMLLMLAVVAAATASAVGESQSLDLDPADGPPGTEVTWVADGFGDCPPVDDAVSEGVVVIAWYAGELGSESVSAADGSASSTLLVPDSATLDAHTVTARCLGRGSMTATREFTVTQPEIEPVDVPNVLGMSEDEARETLEAEELVLGDSTGEGDRVQRQNPSAGRLVDPGTGVDIDLGTAEPDIVEVPDLFGMSEDDAREAVEAARLDFGGATGDPGGRVSDQRPRAGADARPGEVVSVELTAPSPRRVRVPDLVGRDVATVPERLARRGLHLGWVTGEGDEVSRQRPKAGTRVLPGSAVNVSVERGVPPRRLVRVPDLVGSTATDAQAQLDAVGLVLGDVSDDDGEIATQQPEAGTLVPVETTVTVVIAQPIPWRALAAVLVAAVAAGAAGYRILRRRLDRRWVNGHVDVAPGASRAEAAVTQPEGDASPPTHTVRIVPRDDSGTHVLEEAER